MQRDQVDRLFLPFTRLDDRTRHDGFGLGLALVSSIATVHTGTVHATALTTGGLDITVRLPRRYPQEHDDRARTETQKSPRSGQIQNHERDTQPSERNQATLGAASVP